MSWGWEWKPYVSAAQKRANGLRHAKALEKQGRKLEPITITGRKIATTFWGEAWCDNLERYSDYANRLPRGRTYARNGAILDLQIAKGKITAIVCGSDIYHVTIDIATLRAARWKKMIRDCSTSINSLFDLLQGKLSDGVMERLTRQNEGLFPAPKEIRISCSCPDWAGLCKHAAAVMYGIGARLDSRPELLFLLRNVDHEELIQQATAGSSLDNALSSASDSHALADLDLGELFGIELDSAPDEENRKLHARTGKSTAGKARRKKTASIKKAASPAKRTAGKKAVSKRAKPKAKGTTTRNASGSTKKSTTSKTITTSKKGSKSSTGKTHVGATGKKKRTTAIKQTASARKTPTTRK